MAEAPRQSDRGDSASPCPARLRIATRSSRLALWQADHVSDLIRNAFPECHVELIHISTTGDRDQTESLRSFGGMGVFTREVQKALLDGRADIAVHSLKDLPTEPTEGLILGAVPERGPNFDALVLPTGHSGPATLQALPPNARVGTGSLRRQSQLLHLRTDLQLSEVRGNVETRLRKLDDGEYDGLVLAVAGLRRLGLQARISCELSPPVMYPAVGQGALGLECRSDDPSTRNVLARLNDPQTDCRVQAERSLLAALRAGCHAPVGALTQVEGSNLSLEGVVLSARGETLLRATAKLPLADSVKLGKLVANELLKQGAESVIAAGK